MFLLSLYLFGSSGVLDPVVPPPSLDLDPRRRRRGSGALRRGVVGRGAAHYTPGVTTGPLVWPKRSCV